MAELTARIRIDVSLHDLLPGRRRRDELTVPVDGVATIGHAVESLGLPRTETGPILIDGRPADPGDRLAAGAVVEVLRRRALPAGALIRGSDPDEQLADVLDRFDPPLAPWSRCPACNGLLAAVTKDEVADLLEPGTRAAFDEFSRCADCARVYWRGAHAESLDAVVSGAVAAVPPAPAQPSRGGSAARLRGGAAEASPAATTRQDRGGRGRARAG